jgi:hypothetical protein
VILVSGLITYGLASILLRHKVDFSYLQVSILSIALGLINWLFIGAMASWLLQRPLYSFFPIQSIHNNPTGVLFLFIAGASIGAIVFGIGFGFSRLKRWYDRTKKERERGRIRALNQTELLKKGYVPSEKVWVDFLLDNLNLAKQTVGKGYTLLVKVYLREPVNNLTEVIGLLSYFEPSRPYDVVLHPKHIIRLNKTEEELLEELTIDKPNSTSSVTEPLFINGKNILSLEILGFHPFYALMLRSGEEDYTPIFPEGYDFDRYPFTRKGLINLS